MDDPGAEDEDQTAQEEDETTDNDEEQAAQPDATETMGPEAGSDGEDGIAAVDTALQDEDGSPVWAAVGIAAAVLVVLIVVVLLIRRRPNSSQPAQN